MTMLMGTGAQTWGAKSLEEISAEMLLVERLLAMG